jgi:hypothetical protein
MTRRVQLNLGHSAVVSFPVPTHRIAHSIREFDANQAREIQRVPDVRSDPHLAARLVFEALPDEWLEENGKSGELVTCVRYLRGVSTVDQARMHFRLETGISTEEWDSKSCVVTSFPVGTVLTIDLGEAGWIPGQTFVYVILSTQKGALYLEPTHWLKFDWGQLEILTKT